MPYPALSHLSDPDAQAIVAFLKSLPPVNNKVKNFGPGDKVTISVSAVLPPDAYNALPAPKNSAEPRRTSTRVRHFGRKSRPTPLLTNWSV